MAFFPKRLVVVTLYIGVLFQNSEKLFRIFVRVCFSFLSFLYRQKGFFIGLVSKMDKIFTFKFLQKRNKTLPFCCSIIDNNCCHVFLNFYTKLKQYSKMRIAERKKAEAPDLQLLLTVTRFCNWQMQNL